MDRLTRSLALAALGALGLFVWTPSCRRADARTHGIGDHLRPFIVQSSETGETYCQVCAFGGKPTIMVAADLDDPELESHLTRIQQTIARHEKEGLVGFAVIASAKDGSLRPASDTPAVFSRLKAMRARLHLTMPLVTLPAKLTEHELKNYNRFDESYALDGTPTVLFATPESEIVFAERIESGRIDEQHGRLRSRVALVIAQAQQAARARASTEVKETLLPAAGRHPSEGDARSRWTEIIRTLEVDRLDRIDPVDRLAAAHQKRDSASVPLLDLVSRKAPTVVAFWATWCPPCFEEMPVLNALWREGHAVAGVSLDAGDLETARGLLAKNAVAYPSGVLTKQALLTAGAALDQGLPFTLVLDPTGRVRTIHRGVLTKDALAQALAGAAR